MEFDGAAARASPSALVERRSRVKGSSLGRVREAREGRQEGRRGDVEGAVRGLCGGRRGVGEGSLGDGGRGSEGFVGGSDG